MTQIRVKRDLERDPLRSKRDLQEFHDNAVSEAKAHTRNLLLRSVQGQQPVCVCVCVCVCVYVCVCMCVCVCVCDKNILAFPHTFFNTITYTDTQTHTRAHTHTCRSVRPRRWRGALRNGQSTQRRCLYGCVRTLLTLY